MSTLLLHTDDIGARERFMVRLQYWAISVFPFWLQSSSAWPLFISLKKSFSVVSSPRLVAIMSRPTRRMGGTDPSPATSKYFTSSKSPPRNFDHSPRRQSPRLFNAQSSSDNNDTEENRNPLPTLSAEWNDAPLSAANDSHSPIDTPRKKRGSAKTTPGRKPKKTKNQNTPRTQSFAPLTTDLLVGNNEDGDRRVVPHTLILGTHPSIASLEQSQYYGHPMKYVVQKKDTAGYMILSHQMILLLSQCLLVDCGRLFGVSTRHGYFKIIREAIRVCPTLETHQYLAVR